MVQHWISDNTGGNVVILDGMEAPDPYPFFDFPESQAEYITMMAAPPLSGTQPSPGLELIDDVGVAQAKLTINLPYITQAKLLILQLLRKSGKTVFYTSDAGATRWECAFMPSGWKPGRIGGTVDFTLSMEFLVIGPA